MKRLCLYALAAFTSLLVCSCLNSGQEHDVDEEALEEIVYPLGFNPDAFVSEQGRIKSGETLPSLLGRFGLETSLAHKMAELCKDVFDVRKIKADYAVTAYYSGDTLSRALEYLVYDDDKIHSVVFKCQDSLQIWRSEKPTHSERRTSDVTINSSLWNDMLDAGTSPLIILELSDIYAWTVNFFGLQKGDRFRAIYDQTVLEESGEVVAVDSVMFCIYDSGDFHATAIRFDQGDGGGKYWNEKGESLRKAFLKAPLKYNRISSRFSYSRKHPVTGKVKAHTAVDYAAPKGTPVHSIGDGTVTLCGWDSSGGGNRIKIRHMNGYETSYMHLSGFAKGIKAGSRVSQGQLIGYVGSTGTSTGPHLDFRVWKDKTPIDPLKMIAPPSEPLREENMDSLRVLASTYMEMMERAGL